MKLRPLKTRNWRKILIPKKICVTNVTDVNRRGCCSNHGGVCGCSGNKKKCCDGTISPTCKCGE